MSEQAGIVKGPPDIGSGKPIANAVFILPAGTQVVNADGSTTTLTVPTPVYMQKVVLADGKGSTVDKIFDDTTETQMLAELRRIRIGIGKICGDLLEEDDLI